MIADFSICIGTKFIFGHNATDKLGDELAVLGVHKVLVHHDGGSYLEESNLLNTVRTSLLHAGISWVELGGVQPNPRLNLVRKGVEIGQSEYVDAVVAIGGGSVIDSAKAIAIGVPTEHDVWDFFTGKYVPDTTLPVASVLTNPASGSESSQVTVINNSDEQLKLTLSLPIIRPALAFMDPSLTVSLPWFATCCGIVDMFSHICERYFTPTSDFGVIDCMAEAALRSIISNAARLADNPSDYDVRAELMWTATIAQNNTLGVGRDQDWSCHVLGNELSAIYDTPHGASLSVIMSSWMREAWPYNPVRFARFAREVFLVDEDDDQVAVLAGIKAVKLFFHKLAMPTSFAEANIPSNDIERLLDNISFFGSDLAIGSIARLNRSDCRHIFYRAAGLLTE